MFGEDSESTRGVGLVIGTAAATNYETLVYMYYLTLIINLRSS